MPHVISPSEPVSPIVQGIQIAIDRGGTFTDCVGTNIPGKDDVVVKLLSVDPSNYKDAPTEGIRRILEYATGQKLGRGELIDTTPIASIKMGTTVATNALLERSSEPCGLVVSRGFKDLLRIGDQTRPKLFELNIRRAAPLFSKVLEVDERVTQEEYSENPYPKAASELDQLVDGVNVVKGVGGELIRILQPLDAEKARIGLQALFDDGVRSLAIILLHSYTFPQHELEIGRLAREIGFTQISLSSQLLPMIKAVSRGHSAAADAYLTPVVQNYIESFRSGFVGKLEDDSTSTRCQFMQSDGGLVGWQRFNGLRAILSGPAGGVVGFSRTCYDEDTKTPVIGFDMGGTSTDCTRYDGILTHTLETVISGVTIQSPQLEINTVAAGGGSILTYRNGLFKAGPQSAGAHPGPCCYRKGGPLCVTDANLILGRLSPDHFPKIFGLNEDAPLDLAASRAAFEKMTEEINTDLEKTGGKKLSVEEVALGFLDVANESMCRPIRQLTESKGFNSGDHNLASFGGAGGQHACAIADRLKIKRVIIHKHASILSAYGMGLADTVQEAHSPFSGVYASSIKEIAQRLDALQDQVESQLKLEGFRNEDISFERYVNLRYAGSDTVIMILKPADEDYAKAFIKEHQREFSFTLNREVLVENLRVRGRANKGIETMRQAKTITTELSELVKKPISISSDLEHLRVYFEGGWQQSPLFLLKDQTPGDVISGPAMIHDATQMIVVRPRAKAKILKDHIIIDLKDEAPQSDTIVTDVSTIVEDPVQLSIMSNRFMGIAEQMGLTLQRTSVSVNIKERLDFSCALFGPTGGLVANAPHVPVHLGSMEHAVRFQHELHHKELRPGDVLVSNTPLAGGTHLPDITVITPIFDAEGKQIEFYTASRGHHSEVGGILPGSMPASSTKLYEEGAQITSMFLVRDGVFNEAEISKILVDDTGAYPGCSGSRKLSDNLNDLKAQIASNYKGANLVQALIEECGIAEVHFYMNAIKENAAKSVRALLKRTYHQFNGQPLRATDHMDDGTPISVTITINPDDGSAKFDFTGTGLEVLNCFNAPHAITRSATMYVLRCLINEDIPLNEGCLIPITFDIPYGTILNPSGTAAVCAGNPITSQRITDVLIKAFQACAASQGDCNVFSFGFGGKNQETGEVTPGVGFGETVCGGSGAGENWHGTSGVHIHMTNTRITDPEVLEKRYPVILRQFTIRENSGGLGLYNGGNGVIREYEFLRSLSCSVVSERRVYQPFGMHGGGFGKSGLNTLVEQTKDGERRVNVGGRKDFTVQKGDRFIFETPGGGGWGVQGTSGAKEVMTGLEEQFMLPPGYVNSIQLMQEQSN